MFKNILVTEMCHCKKFTKKMSTSMVPSAVKLWKQTKTNLAVLDAESSSIVCSLHMALDLAGDAYTSRRVWEPLIAPQNLKEDWEETRFRLNSQNPSKHFIVALASVHFFVSIPVTQKTHIP